MAKTKTIAEIRRALAAQEKRLAKLQARRSKIAAKLQRVESEIASLSGEPAAARPGRPKKARKKVAKKKARRVVRKVAKKAVGRPKQTRGKPLTQYLAQALSRSKAGMRAKDLTTAVLKAGYVTKDKNFKQTVAKSLGTDKRFKRVSRGVYVLAG